jgi:hypothetical protein
MRRVLRHLEQYRSGHVLPVVIPADGGSCVMSEARPLSKYAQKHRARVLREAMLPEEPEPEPEPLPKSGKLAKPLPFAMVGRAPLENWNH